METAPIACKSWQPSHEPSGGRQTGTCHTDKTVEKQGEKGEGGTTSESPHLKLRCSWKTPTQCTTARKPRGPRTHGIMEHMLIYKTLLTMKARLALLDVNFVKLKGLVQKGRISNFGRFSFFCRIELIFGRLTCFDMKSIVP